MPLCLGRSSFADETKMGMAEGRRIFQAVSEGSVEPQMGNPDEGVRYDLRIENKACREQSERDNIGMEAIINKSPGSGAAIIGQKRKVWGKEQDREKNPTRTRLRIGCTGRCQDGHTLDA